MKTIIPAKAGAKLSARLVPGQDPQKICEIIESYIRSQVPDCFTVEITDKEAGGPALRVNPQSAPIERARSILSEVGTGEVELLWEGASIPFLSALSQVSGASPLLVGFGLEEDSIHAPNESFSLDQFRKGYQFCREFLSRSID
jgi:acetylornithine deacetylase/succinyl-diaminopimelate desuccinylase-like protein